jgi:hypothetical protein
MCVPEVGGPSDESYRDFDFGNVSMVLSVFPREYQESVFGLNIVSFLRIAVCLTYDDNLIIFDAVNIYSFCIFL